MVRGGFLNAPPVDVEECPTWKNPHSAEAQEVCVLLFIIILIWAIEFSLDFSYVGILIIRLCFFSIIMSDPRKN